ncbi:hypothetical protein AOLI_G00275800, partial [Acnodon oligacanthus]
MGCGCVHFSYSCMPALFHPFITGPCVQPTHLSIRSDPLHPDSSREKQAREKGQGRDWKKEGISSAAAKTPLRICLTRLSGTLNRARIKRERKRGDFRPHFKGPPA